MPSLMKWTYASIWFNAVAALAHVTLAALSYSRGSYFGLVMHPVACFFHIGCVWFWLRAIRKQARQLLIDL